MEAVTTPVTQTSIRASASELSLLYLRICSEDLEPVYSDTDTGQIARNGLAA